jgi:hypothetical protein
MYFKMDINVRTDRLLMGWGYKVVDSSEYHISWSDTVIIENDEINQLLARMAQGDPESEERLWGIAKGIEERITDFLLSNFVVPYFEEDGAKPFIVEETWKMLAKYASDTTITLPTTRGFIIVSKPRVGIDSRRDDAGNTWYYVTADKSYAVSIVVREDIHWLHGYLKKIEEKVQNLAELVAISTSYTPEIECETKCNCGY